MGRSRSGRDVPRATCHQTDCASSASPSRDGESRAPAAGAGALPYPRDVTRRAARSRRRIAGRVCTIWDIACICVLGLRRGPRRHPRARALCCRTTHDRTRHPARTLTTTRRHQPPAYALISIHLLISIDNCPRKLTRATSAIPLAAPPLPHASTLPHPLPCPSLGRGKAREVLEALDVDTGHTVALKCYRLGASSVTQARAVADEVDIHSRIGEATGVG